MLIFLLAASSATLAGISGLYYGFACAVMPGLRRADDATFVRTMSHINSAIQNPWFALGFAGAFISLGATAIYGWVNGLDAALPATLAWAFYSASLAITFARNIPLNNRLDQHARGSNPGQGRIEFEARWILWNIHRCWLCLAAVLCLCLAWASGAR
ncbi:DUF1772 domain-containing protein [Pseudarthrobacter sp. J75]|uniref:anthrone oxygenase family protein n=1 Tax=unclassified Pseudarthrobacter TaxID=2647000 RepID=UPI002E81101F|nr:MULTISPECIES: DUF1772 domain-containing protein [unclassified Pseudarthrobacter]MEE2521996.1 DUF1772 domain-containing protein [Pseudarthrobacter sp. J47]MEE2528921.1 DUF1772 domain-containing protein [Pseudarthrobacter sp. J75]MEE2570276.1 DUF1772 domain-containing protein [Pseudarthrobacter sp. J64]